MGGSLVQWEEGGKPTLLLNGLEGKKEGWVSGRSARLAVDDW